MYEILTTFKLFRKISWFLFNSFNFIWFWKLLFLNKDFQMKTCYFVSIQKNDLFVKYIFQKNKIRRCANSKYYNTYSTFWIADKIYLFALATVSIYMIRSELLFKHKYIWLNIQIDQKIRGIFDNVAFNQFLF